MLNLLLPGQLSFCYARTLFHLKKYCDYSNIYIFMFCSFFMIRLKDFLWVALQISKYDSTVYFNEKLLLFKKFCKCSCHVSVEVVSNNFD